MESVFVEALLNPASYDEPTSSVRLVQTHISFIFITDAFVYKVKKPVDFGFLNFTTLDRRRFYCEEEVRLNRRLCPDLYLGVVEIRESPDGIRLDGTGEIIDYAVKMKRLPEDRMLDRLLTEGRVSEEEIREIGRIVGDFHLRAERNRETDSYGSLEVIRKNWTENFEQTEPFLSRTLTKADLDIIRSWVERFMEEKADLFASRVAGGFIRDCNGDLHSGNICMAERAYIFDCIEFNTRFRFSDTAADLAFILMDLEYRGRRDFATILFHEYLDVTKDRGVVELLDFYRIYRAFVRGKVESFRLDDPRIGVEEKEAAAKIARRYFRLARGYILRRELSPRLIVFSGLMGTGKSTLARELSFELGLDMITSDILRKELAGLSKTERRRDEYNEGIYTADFTGKTYGEMFRRAEDILRKGQSVILDASFSRKEERFRAMDLARKTGAEISFFRAVCSDETVRERLRERESDTSEPSDGRWELYSRQKRDFDPFVSPLEKCGEVDTSLPVEENTVRILQVMGVSSK